MATKEKAAVETPKEKVDDGLAAKVRHLEEKVKKMSENWKRFCDIHIGPGGHSDGKLVSLALACLMAFAVSAGAKDYALWSPFDTNVYGVATISGNETNGYTKLTVVEVNASTVTANNITFSGTYTGLTGTILISNITATGASTLTGPSIYSNAANKFLGYTGVFNFVKADLISNTAGKVYAYTNDSVNTKVTGLLDAVLVSNAALKVCGSTGVVDTLTVNTTVTLPAGGVANAALAGKAELATLVTPVITTNANGGTNIVVLNITDIAGTALTYPCAVRMWFSTDGQGTPAAMAAGSISMGTGVVVQTVSAATDYWLLSTNMIGKITLTATNAAGYTNIIHVMAPCGRVTKVTNAFNAP